MLNLETAIQKLKKLSPEQQQQVFQLVEDLEQRAEEVNDFFAIAGIWEDREISVETLRKQAGKNQIMEFAGSWSDMSEEDFQDFTEEIEQRRQNSTSRRTEF